MSVLHKCLNSIIHVKTIDCFKAYIPVSYFAAKATSASAAGGVAGLGKGKKKISKLGGVEKKQLPVETDPNKLVEYVCGSNIYVTGEDVKLKPNEEYPEWLWNLNLSKPPKIEEMDPNTKEYWLKVRTMAMRRNNKLSKLKRFH